MGHQAPVPMQEPCGYSMGDPRLGAMNETLEVHARLFDLNNDSVRCVVPKERLFEIDLFSQSIDGVMLQLSEFLNVPPVDEEFPHCVGGPHKESSAPLEELKNQSSHCPLNRGGVSRLALSSREESVVSAVLPIE